MIRSVFVAFAMAATTVPAANACDAVVSVAPSAVVSGAFYAPLAVNVAPTAAFAPAAVEVDAFALGAAPFGVRVLGAPVRVRACIAPRARLFARPIRSRVVVRVR